MVRFGEPCGRFGDYCALVVRLMDLHCIKSAKVNKGISKSGRGLWP